MDSHSESEHNAQIASIVGDDSFAGEDREFDEDAARDAAERDLAA